MKYEYNESIVNNDYKDLDMDRYIAYVMEDVMSNHIVLEDDKASNNNEDDIIYGDVNVQYPPPLTPSATIVSDDNSHVDSVNCFDNPASSDDGSSSTISEVSTDPPSPGPSNNNHIKRTMKKKKRSPVFPQRLYDMLEDAEKEGYSHLISWSPDGKSFKVWYNATAYSNDKSIIEILKKRLNQNNFIAFLRQLESYGFEIERQFEGSQRRGECKHPLFTRGQRHVLYEKSVKDFQAATTQNRKGGVDKSLQGGLASSLSLPYSCKRKWDIVEKEVTETSSFTDLFLSCDHPDCTKVSGCPKMYANLSNRNRHFKEKHNNVQQHECNFPGCRYISYRSDNLELHKRTERHTAVDMHRYYVTPTTGCRMYTPAQHQRRERKRLLDKETIRSAIKEAAIHGSMEGAN